MSAWRMAFRAGNKGDEMWPICRELGVAALTYRLVGDIDLTNFPKCIPQENWSKLASPKKASLRRFMEMREGDVIYVKQGPKIVGKGVVSGPYHFDSLGQIQTPDGTRWKHQRPVNWVRSFPEITIQVGRNQLFLIDPLTEEDVARIERATGGKSKPQSPPRIGDESDIEGLKIEILSIKTQRSRVLRDIAFAASKNTCAVCGRDFSELLAGRGIRVLQVHHREQLSLRDEPAVTTLDDLVVVCANCHLLLHLDSQKTLSVDELRRLLKNDDYLYG